MNLKIVTPAKAGVYRWIPAFAGMTLFIISSLSWAKTEPVKLADKLLRGNEATRFEAIQEFNKLPPDAQYKLVPDFMVALTDDDSEVRKIASRILKAMGVKTEAQVPDVKKEIAPAPSTGTVQDKWAEEKKMRDAASLPDAQKELTTPTTAAQGAPSGQDQWADLKKMRDEESGHYSGMQKELDDEKKGQVTLDAAQLKSDGDSSASPMSVVTESLKDPDPWVRAQAARRLAMIRPAPTQAIPTLIKMLGDKDVDCRKAAVAALGSFGHLAQDAVLPLNTALSDPNPDVRTLASDALQQIQTQP